MTISARQAVLAKSNIEIQNLQKNIDNKQNSLTAGQTYLQKSVLMQIDPAAKGIAKLDIGIDLVGNDQMDPAQKKAITISLVSNYLQAINNEELFSFVNEYTGLRLAREYMAELIAVRNETVETFTIEASYKDADTALSISYAVLDYFRMFSLNTLQIMQPHTLNIEAIRNTTEADPELTTLRAAKETANTGFSNIITANQGKIRAIVLADLEANAITSVPQRAILGGLLGLLLGAGIQVARFMFGTRLRGPDEVRQRLGLYVIGTVSPLSVPMPEKSMALGSRIDHLIDKTFDKQKRAWTHDESLRYTCASLLNMIHAARTADPAHPFHRVFCTGSMDPAELKNVVHMLEANMKSTGQPDDFELVVGNSLQSSAESLLLLDQSDGAVLFEKPHKSRYASVRKTMGILAVMGKSVLGLVLVE